MQITQVAPAGDTGFPGLKAGARRLSITLLRRKLPTPSIPVILAIGVLAVILVCAVFPGAFAPYGPTDMDGDAVLSPPGAHHWLGTDHFGRDILSLLIYGAGQSVTMAVGTVLIAVCIGGSIGLLTGYIGGLTDFLLMRLVDVWMSVPQMMLAIIIATALRASFSHTILAVGVVLVAPFIRLIRGQVMSVRARPFIAASHAIGTGHATIIVRHVLPHCAAPLLVQATLSVALAILVASALSFIGIGVIEDRPDWGFLLSQGHNYLTVAWWYPTFPGLAITGLVISVNALGNALRIRLDPRTAQR
jgi:peptide/nickel transport system permease protein